MKKESKLKNNKTMKKQLLTLASAIALLAGGFTANANENEREITVSTLKQKAVVLKVDNIQEGTQISLRDAEGNLLFKDQASANNYGKVFNLSQMEEGQLYLEIDNNEKLEVMSIDVTATEASLNEKSELVIDKPVVKVANGQMKVYFGENGSDMDMKIYDNLGSVAFAHDNDDKGAGMKRFDISNLSAGQYEIQFTANGRNIFHTITLN